MITTASGPLGGGIFVTNGAERRRGTMRRAFTQIVAEVPIRPIEEGAPA